MIAIKHFFRRSIHQDWSQFTVLGFVQLAFLLVIFSSCTPLPYPPAAKPATFRNPLNSSRPDPWMTYYDGTYYLAATTWGSANIGLTMAKAATIEELKNTKPAQIWQDSNPSRSSNYWAPEFFLLDGPDGKHWYGYFTGGPAECCDNQRMNVIESAGTDPMGPYTYKAQLKDSIDGWAIDTSVLQLNGKLYLLFSAFEGPDINAITHNQNIYIAPMSNPWTVSGDRVLLSAPALSWERQDGNVNEGPVALQHGGKTFIVYSASGCWGPNYKLGMLTLTGEDPLKTSAWKKSKEPVFQSANDILAPGHNTFFKSPDGKEDWIVYHANTTIPKTGGCDMNRTTRIQKFTWNSDGTPNFGEPIPLTADLTVPSGEGNHPLP